MCGKFFNILNERALSSSLEFLPFTSLDELLSRSCTVLIECNKRVSNRFGSQKTREVDRYEMVLSAYLTVVSRLGHICSWNSRSYERLERSDNFQVPLRNQKIFESPVRTRKLWNLLEWTNNMFGLGVRSFIQPRTSVGRLRKTVQKCRLACCRMPRLHTLYSNPHFIWFSCFIVKISFSLRDGQ